MGQISGQGHFFSLQSLSKTSLNKFTGNAIGESALLAYNRYYSDYVLELLKTDREKFLKKTFGFFRSRAFGKV